MAARYVMSDSKKSSNPKLVLIICHLYIWLPSGNIPIFFKISKKESPSLSFNDLTSFYRRS
ncbi:hypothetical protein C8R44DRAFT_768689 [Mycena epipterygia]|nr:hypothetical protein C8R44DRAFT_768689 [Mycena epipterygia]